MYCKNDRIPCSINMGEPNCTGMANHRAVDTVFERSEFIILDFFMP